MKTQDLMQRIKLVRRRRGVTAMLAMLYLILFSALAVGFYGAVTTSVQIVGNEQRGSRAFLAAESGMEFMRHHLASLKIDEFVPLEERMLAIYDYLEYELDYYVPRIAVDLVDGVIRVPANPDAFIALDDHTGFRATIGGTGDQVVVTTVGRYTGGGTTQTVIAGRGIELKYGVASRASNIFDYGVASRSAITMDGNARITGAGGNSAYGSVMADTDQNPPLIMDGSARISGDVSVTGSSLPSVSPQSEIGGLKGAKAMENVTTDVESPDFPKVNSLIFEPYVPGPGVLVDPQVISIPNPVGTSFENIRIKAGANPTFAANTTIRGVIYIETPNQVSFQGGADITGVIVQQHEATGNSGSNVLDFGGNATLKGVQDLPDQPQFQGLHELTGSSILAPDFRVTFRGTFGTVAGTVIGGQIQFTGNAGGTIKGSVINMEPNTTMSLAGNNTITIESQGTSDYPAGVFFGENYVPIPGSYREIKP